MRVTCSFAIVLGVLAMCAGHGASTDPTAFNIYLPKCPRDEHCMEVVKNNIVQKQSWLPSWLGGGPYFALEELGRRAWRIPQDDIAHFMHPDQFQPKSKPSLSLDHIGEIVKKEFDSNCNFVIEVRFTIAPQTYGGPFHTVDRELVFTLNRTLDNIYQDQTNASTPFWKPDQLHSTRSRNSSEKFHVAVTVASTAASTGAVTLWSCIVARGVSPDSILALATGTGPVKMAADLGFCTAVATATAATAATGAYIFTTTNAPGSMTHMSFFVGCNPTNFVDSLP